MKRIALFGLVILSMALVGCSTTSQLHLASEATHLPADSQFTVGETIDSSGYVFQDQKEKFSLSDSWASSLNAVLSKEGLTGNSAKYVIKTKITEYAPGNAFTRWVLPGAGATKLSAETVIYTADNIEIARIPVSRSIAAGGGYTINAWKYVFDDVAQETVKVIKTQLMVPKS